MKSIGGASIQDTRMTDQVEDQALVYAILQAIDGYSKAGNTPVNSDMLEHLGPMSQVLDYLMRLKKDRVIGGDLISDALTNAPRRMASLKLTYSGLKALSYGPD